MTHWIQTHFLLLCLWTGTRAENDADFQYVNTARGFVETHATYTNEVGRFTCACNTGYSGTILCNGIDECMEDHGSPTPPLPSMELLVTLKEEFRQELQLAQQLWQQLSDATNALELAFYHGWKTTMTFVQLCLVIRFHVARWLVYLIEMISAVLVLILFGWIVTWSCHSRAVELAQEEEEGEEHHSIKEKEEEEDVCAICLEALPTKRRTLRCQHQFCPTCIANWLKQKPHCPVCIRPVVRPKKK